MFKFYVNENAKEKCQVFTPANIAAFMLDLAGYKEEVVGKRILENSCGNGAILKEIVRRYVSSALNQGFAISEIKEGLETDIVGRDIDGGLVKEVKRSLNEIVSAKGITGVRWNIRATDFLFDEKDDIFSFIVGNPPYLEYKMIDPSYRLALKDKYRTCAKGKFDYCYAFIESSIAQLAEDGVLVLLVPGSIFKNVSARELRELLKPGIDFVFDYAGRKVFDNALVSPCAFRYRKEENSDYLEYRSAKESVTKKIDKGGLQSKWKFEPENKLSTTVLFGDCFRASMTIATLRNKAFLLGPNDDIEVELVKKAASPKTERVKLDQRILFPYTLTDESDLRRIPAEEFERSYPKAMQHLMQHKSELDSRKADPSAAWYEYGRNQGLALVGIRKLLISTVVTKKVNVYELEENIVPFAGIAITIPKNSAHTLSEAKTILESCSFLEYAYQIGTPISGESVRITCRDVSNFLISH